MKSYLIISDDVKIIHRIAFVKYFGCLITMLLKLYGNRELTHPSISNKHTTINHQSPYTRVNEC